MNTTKLKQLKEKMATLRREYVETAKSEFTELSKELFESYPDLKSFGWVQYTPYFNDGEECTFSAHTDQLSINGYGGYNESEDGEGINLLEAAESRTWVDSKFVAKPVDDKAKEVVDAVETFLKSFDDDFLKEMFGNHVSVTVTASGTSTDDYEHE